MQVLFAVSVSALINSPAAHVGWSTHAVSECDDLFWYLFAWQAVQNASYVLLSESVKNSPDPHTVVLFAQLVTVFVPTLCSYDSHAVH